jgi:hypothetical protein
LVLVRILRLVLGPTGRAVIRVLGPRSIATIRLVRMHLLGGLLVVDVSHAI